MNRDIQSVTIIEIRDHHDKFELQLIDNSSTIDEGVAFSSVRNDSKAVFLSLNALCELVEFLGFKELKELESQTLNFMKGDSGFAFCPGEESDWWVYTYAKGNRRTVSYYTAYNAIN